MTRPVLILVAAALLAGGRGALHTHLVKAEPAVDTTVAAAPSTLRLWFSTRPEPALSGATLLGGDNAPVAVVKLAATDDTLSVAGAIPVRLTPGKYTVAWKTGARDGHVVRGKYSFTYAPAAAPTP
jgi:methionine-rich copper-binding protein CopC